MEEEAYGEFLKTISSSERKLLADEIERSMNEACAATKKAQLARLLPRGTSVRITGLQRCAHLNEREGTLLGVFDGERIPVRVRVDDDEHVEVRVRLGNLRPCKPRKIPTTRRSEIIKAISSGLEANEEDAPVTVLWVTNRGGNTGHNGYGIDRLCSILTNMTEKDANSPLRTQKMTLKQIHEIYERERFALHRSRLCEKFGLHLLCYSNPNHAGPNNVIATYFTCDAKTGLAPQTVSGPALLIRLSPSTGEATDFEFSEAVRAFRFISDLMEWYPSPPLCEGHGFPEFFRAIAACYPYYDVACQMQLKGFIGRQKKVHLLNNGTLLKEPENLMPVPSHVF